VSLANDLKIVKLEDVADIRVSNVDKKTLLNEPSVKLCNYMDVYNNDYIRAHNDYMIASASLAEIEKFKVEVGDVLITKDSETPFDIGIPSVVTDNIQDLVCGYHLALLKPNKKVIDPIYLSKQLGSNNTASYYLKNASGSTRYGLSNGAIAKTPIPLFPLSQQNKIGQILTTIDRLIEKTQALIDKHTAIKQGMMADLFTRGIDLTTGQLRPPVEQASHLYKETELGWVPKDWDICPIKDLSMDGLKNGYFKKPELVGSGYKLINVSELYQDYGIDITLNAVERVEANAKDYNKYKVEMGDLFFTRSSLVLSGIAKCNISRELPEPALYECHVMRLRPNQVLVNPDYLALYCQTRPARDYLMARAKQVTMTTIAQPDIQNMPVYKLSIDEQQMIVNKIITSSDVIKSNEIYIKKLRNQKQGLMQDLLTGKVKVN